MKFIPAIDLKDNKCVRLKKGKEENLTIFNDDPVNQAKFFEKNGCERIHIVDLDGAFGRADVNKQTILNIRKNTKIEIELGGGIRSENDLDDKIWDEVKKAFDLFNKSSRKWNGCRFLCSSVLEFLPCMEHWYWIWFNFT